MFFVAFQFPPSFFFDPKRRGVALSGGGQRCLGGLPEGWGKKMPHDGRLVGFILFYLRLERNPEKNCLRNPFSSGFLDPEGGEGQSGSQGYAPSCLTW